MISLASVGSPSYLAFDLDGGDETVTIVINNNPCWQTILPLENTVMYSIYLKAPLLPCGEVHIKSTNIPT